MTTPTAPSVPTIAIVTGASRGAGHGIAIALGSHGCTVYVTGRSEKSGEHSLPGTIHETARAVSEAGGRGIAVRCDHADDRQVQALVEQVIAEQGRIDILVNNAAAIYDELSAPGNFWEKPQARRYRHGGRSQRLCCQLVRGTAHDQAKQRFDSFHLGIRRRSLFDGASLWRAQGWNGQAGFRHGCRLSGSSFQGRCAFHLDGSPSD